MFIILNYIDRFNMAALHKNQEIIDEVKRLGEAPIPWCDEYEKMISGMRYALPFQISIINILTMSSFRSANDESLQKYRISTMKYIRSFNDGSIPDGSTIEILRARRMGVAKKLLGRLGTAVNIETPFFVGWGCNTFIGDDVYLNRE
jgi:maltose O-acetyltransferase